MSIGLSVVVIAYDMARELPRTLYSLSPRHQRGIDGSDYELIVVDNGSPEPIDEATLGAAGSVEARRVRLAPASASPARAANTGLEMARGELIGLLIDGARIASPGLLHHALLGARLADHPIVATLGWHLGPVMHKEAAAAGYDRAAEDELLERSGWIDNGYSLFALSTLAGSSRRGWFGPIGQSNALFMPRTCWEELGGLDERFELPGGGLVNHDLFRRACALARSQLVVLIGEGTFHQIHGGASTSLRVDRDDAWRDYERLRGRPYEAPADEPLYCGHLPEPALAHLERSVRWRISAGRRGGQDSR